MHVAGAEAHPGAGAPGKKGGQAEDGPLPARVREGVTTRPRSRTYTGAAAARVRFLSRPAMSRLSVSSACRWM